MVLDVKRSMDSSNLHLSLAKYWQLGPFLHKPQMMGPISDLKVSIVFSPTHFSEQVFQTLPNATPFSNNLSKLWYTL